MIRAALVSLGTCVAMIAYVLGLRRSVTLANIRRAFPGKPIAWQKRVARSSYRELGRTFAELLYLRFASLKSIRNWVRLTNPDTYHAALLEGKGLIVVAAHYANWEWLALGGAMALGSNFAIVRKNIQSSFTERFLEKLRLRSGNTLINAGDVRGMVRTLKSGHCLAMLADQSAPSESVRVEFFGTPTPTQEGPAWLATKTGARMLFAECQPQRGGVYRITFHPIEIGTEDTVQTVTQKHTAILENIIAARPEPWVWQHKRWKYVS